MVGQWLSRVAVVAIMGMGMGMGLAPSLAADNRHIDLTEGTDSSGKDYSILKDIDQKACAAACLADSKCGVFTYNTRVKWCFLKTDAGTLKPAASAVTGKVVVGAAPVVDVTAKRIAELTFLNDDDFKKARTQLEGFAKLDKAGKSEDQALAQGDELKKAKDAIGAYDQYAIALAWSPKRSSNWVNLGEAADSATTDDESEKAFFIDAAFSAAINGFLTVDTVADRAGWLGYIGDHLKSAERYKAAIQAFRASLALRADKVYKETYDKLLAEHGFRILTENVDNDSARPRVCVQFSDKIEPKKIEPGDYVSVKGGEKLALSIEDSSICIDGVVHGGRYTITVRDGLPSADGEKLAKASTLDVYVRDRAPDVHFIGKGYVVPAGGEATVPLVSVNTKKVLVQVLRISDRRIAKTITDGTFQRSLGSYEVQGIADRDGEQVFKGWIDVSLALNKDITTAVPIGKMVPRLTAGVYVMVANLAKPGTDSVDEDDYRSHSSSQWFIVSDLGLATFNGTDGLTVAVRSLSTAAPVANVKLKLTALDEDILGEVTTDPAGVAKFDPGLMNGRGGKSPAVLVAETQGGDYAFLDLTKPAFDLTDRGVGGRAEPSPLDVFMTPERGIYRPGEPIIVTILARDRLGNSAPKVPLTVVVTRPDGVEHSRKLVDDEGLGGRVISLAMPSNAARGAWGIAAYADPKANPVAQISVKVQDFVPERLDFTLTNTAQVFDPKAPGAVDLSAKFLYGAPASNLATEGEVVVREAKGIPGFDGWNFGLRSDNFTEVYQSLDAGVTDETGKAHLPLLSPTITETTKPLEAITDVRVVDTTGHAVERTLALPILPKKGRLAIKELFDGYAPEGGSASFKIAALSAEGKPIPLDGLNWELKKIEHRFVWYKSSSSWDYEMVNSATRVASGTLAIGADPADLSTQVGWGEYELSITDPASRALPVSVSFDAGYFVAPKAVDTPDAMKVSLDQPHYARGATARAHLEGRFPGVALVTVLSDHIVDMKTVEVPATGADVDFKVTDAWGPGTYITATLIRGMDLKVGRMPARAIGLAYAAVEPGDRALKITLDTPEKMEPRRTMDIAVSVAGEGAGEEAYVSISAVDLGILNLTHFAPPDPEGYYFGQRQLGVELRDLYGQLIDRMLGTMGVVHTGGDRGAGLRSPPPTEKLLAIVSGLVKIGADGKAHVAFDIPDFNGTVRLTALAWSKTGLGHAVKDVLVRDGIVATIATPRFLGLGDLGQMSVDLTHVDGPAGQVSVALAAEGGAVALDPEQLTKTLTLSDKGKGRVTFPLKGWAIGDSGLNLTITTPDQKKLLKHLDFGVRDLEPVVTSRQTVSLAPGATLNLTAPSASADNFVTGTGRVTLAVGGLGVDLGGLLASLDRYPYGCSEQLTSRALPLLYVDAVSASVGLGPDAALSERVQKAIDAVLLNQSSSGGFGLWGPGSSDEERWLGAYVADFLTRAREKGYKVPDIAFELALKHLQNMLSYSDEIADGAQDFAYALYVLARNGRASIGDLRYYADVKRDKFRTTIGLAQLGASLALYGDKGRAASVYRSAVTALNLIKAQPAKDALVRIDYGTSIRDAAVLMTLIAETKVDGVETKNVARFLQENGNGKSLSTQEQSWLVLAANAALGKAATSGITVDGAALPTSGLLGTTAEALIKAPVAIFNGGKDPEFIAATSQGIPRQAPPASDNGYHLSRSYFTLDGGPLKDLTHVKLGQRVVVLLSVEAKVERAGRLIVNDPLPAGFEIDNPALVRAGDVKQIPEIATPEKLAMIEYRIERLLAAVDREPQDPKLFELAYVIRAVSPGTFAAPSAVVEDMYSPSINGRTGAATATVVQ